MHYGTHFNRFKWKNVSALTNTVLKLAFSDFQVLILKVGQHVATWSKFCNVFFFLALSASYCRVFLGFESVDLLYLLGRRQISSLLFFLQFCSICFAYYIIFSVCLPTLQSQVYRSQPDLTAVYDNTSSTLAVDYSYGQYPNPADASHNYSQYPYPTESTWIAPEQRNCSIQLNLDQQILDIIHRLLLLSDLFLPSSSSSSCNPREVQHTPPLCPLWTWWSSSPSSAQSPLSWTACTR